MYILMVTGSKVKRAYKVERTVMIYVFKTSAKTRRDVPLKATIE